MDQLKIVLEHKFWLLAGLAALLPPIGWYMATDDLATQTLARQRAVESAFKDAVLKPAPEVYPNDDWIADVKKVDVEIGKTVEESQARLYERQKPAMVWPQLVQSYLDAAHVRFRTEPKEADFTEFLHAKLAFANLYDQVWQNAVKPLDPLVPATGDGKILIGEGLTLDMASIVITRASVKSDTMNFSATQMWDAQEDIWFLSALVQAIARVNKGSTRIDDAPIKKLSQLVLRGGSAMDLNDRRSGKNASQSASAGGRPAPSFSLGFGGGHSGGSGSDAGYKAPPPFDPDDVFGSDGSMEDPHTTKKDRGLNAPTDVQRYLESRTPKWARRGFVLYLVMDEREIPTLIGELSASPFPTEIRHVEHMRFDPKKDRAQLTSVLNTLKESQATSEDPKLQAEQQKRLQKVKERLDLSFSASYLANVTVCGAFTIYSEPASAGVAQTMAAAPAKSVAGTATITGATAKKGDQAAKPASAAAGNRPSGPKAKSPSAAGGSSQAPAPKQVPGTSGKAAPGATSSPSTRPAAPAPSKAGGAAR
jgi:hypothetical protein